MIGVAPLGAVSHKSAFNVIFVCASLRFFGYFSWFFRFTNFIASTLHFPTDLPSLSYHFVSHSLNFIYTSLMGSGECGKPRAFKLCCWFEAYREAMCTVSKISEPETGKGCLTLSL